MTSYRKYKFETGKEPVNDAAAGKLYKCEINKVYDPTYKLYRNLTVEQKKERKFRLCTLATDDDNKHLSSLMKTINEIERNWDNTYRNSFSIFKGCIINNCMLEKKDNYYDVLDIMLKYFACTFVNIDNFKHFLLLTLFYDYNKISNINLGDNIHKHVNTVIDALTVEEIKEIKKIGSFYIFTKIIKLIVIDILHTLFHIQEDLKESTVIDKYIEYATLQIILKEDINDDRTLLGIWCEKTIYDYIYYYLENKNLKIPESINVSLTDNILEYRNNLINNVLNHMFDINSETKNNLKQELSYTSISFTSIFNILPQTGGSNRKPHTRINYINNKNMYYNL